MKKNWYKEMKARIVLLERENRNLSNAVKEQKDNPNELQFYKSAIKVIHNLTKFVGE